MDRTVPKTGSEEIELYIRTYYSLLRSSHAVQLDALVEAHVAMNSSLHVNARQPKPDASAVFYAIMRLPPCMADVDLVVMGQTDRVFRDYGYEDIETWTPVAAPARRRRMMFDGKHTLATYIASRSDIDDLIPILVAYQIEWNKLHGLLQSISVQAILAAYSANATLARTADLAHVLSVSPDELSRLQEAWGPQMIPTLEKIARAPKRIMLRLLAGTYINYQRAMSDWWSNVRRSVPSVILDDRPVYFVSSNVHAIPNLLSGFALQEEDEILDYVERANDPALKAEYDYVRVREELNNKNNFLYYALRRYSTLPDVDSRRREVEESVGITRVPSLHGFDIEAQVIELNKLDLDAIDPRLMCCGADGMEPLLDSDAVIVNIDYPLGMAAYHLLAKISQYVHAHAGHLRDWQGGVTLNARVGDADWQRRVRRAQPKLVPVWQLFHRLGRDPVPYADERWTTRKSSCARHIPAERTVWTCSIAKATRSSRWKPEPYLSAVARWCAPSATQSMRSSTCTSPLDIGFLHYASDTPMSKGRNLGAGRLSYLGAEPTYATAVAALRRIFSQELARLRAESPRSRQAAGKKRALGDNGASSASDQD